MSQSFLVITLQGGNTRKVMKRGKPRVKLDPPPIVIPRCPHCGDIGGWHKPECVASTVESLRYHIERLTKDEAHSRRKWAMCSEWAEKWQGKFMAMKLENRKLKAKIKALQKAEK